MATSLANVGQQRQADDHQPQSGGRESRMRFQARGVGVQYRAWGRVGRRTASAPVLDQGQIGLGQAAAKQRAREAAGAGTQFQHGRLAGVDVTGDQAGKCGAGGCDGTDPTWAGGGGAEEAEPARCGWGLHAGNRPWIEGNATWGGRRRGQSVPTGLWEGNSTAVVSSWSILANGWNSGSAATRRLRLLDVLARRHSCLDWGLSLRLRRRSCRDPIGLPVARPSTTEPIASLPGPRRPRRPAPSATIVSR